MGTQLTRGVAASEIAAALKLPLQGDDVFIDRVAALHGAGPGAMSFSRVPLAEELPGVLVLAPEASAPLARGGLIRCQNPRLVFARALGWLQKEIGFIDPAGEPFIHPEARVSPHAWIGPGVRIGRGTVVGHFAVLTAGVSVGENCAIKSGAVIGENGFGFERDEAGDPVRLPHLGSVIIGNSVEIGSLTTVCRGMLDDTVIEDFVKIDDHVHVGHNCVIRRAALVTACVEISGGVDVGAYAWIGPNVSIIQKVKIGNHAFIGIGSTVIKNVAPGARVAGNPAMRID